jgi:hypothetical protein
MIGSIAQPGHRLPGRSLAVITAAAALVVLAGCGAPEYTYVTHSKEGTYLRVPASWRPIAETQLQSAHDIDPAVADAVPGLWMAGYDASEAPSAQHIFGSDATEPVAFLRVQQVPPTARGGLSLDFLRDLYFPTTAERRQQLESSSAKPPFTDFRLLTDQVLTPGNGLRGIHTVFRYRLFGGPTQVIDKTAYLNDDASVFYVLMMRCSVQCHEERRKEIEAVVSSFTIRKQT